MRACVSVCENMHFIATGFTGKMPQSIQTQCVLSQKYTGKQTDIYIRYAHTNGRLQIEEKEYNMRHGYMLE